MKHRIFFVLVVVATMILSRGTYGQTLRAVQVLGGNAGTAVGFSGTVLHTTDGTNWNSQSSQTGLNLHGVSFTDANTGTAVGGDEYSSTVIIHTVNGGSNWTPQASGVANSLQSVSFVDANTGVAVGNHGTIIRTINGGTNWAAVSSGITNDLISVSLTSGGAGCAVGFNGVILRTANGGASWSSQTSPTINNLNGVHFVDANNGTAVGSFGTIAHTVNGGSTWTLQTSGTSEELYGVYFSDANNGTVVGYTGTILRTVNGGATWTPQVSGTIQTLLAVSFSDANNGVVVGGSKIILKTANGGATWGLASSSSGGSSIAPPALLLPANGAIAQPTTETLSWSASSGATGYRVQVSASSAFSSLLVDDSSLTTTTRVVSGLANSTTYYWRVNARNSSGTSAWSAVWNFTTVALTPVFSVNPTSINFGGVTVGVSKQDSVVVSNGGAATLNITNIKSSSAQFTVSPTTATILAGGSQKIYITFKPSKKASYSGTITFTHNAPGSPNTVTVSGSGASAPRAATIKNVTTINFGPVPEGSSKESSFILDNVGAVDLSITSVVSTNSAFSVTPTTGTIAAGGSLQFNVSVAPTTEISQSGYVVISYADVLSPDSVFVRTDMAAGVKVVETGLPATYDLGQNYPNPFNPTTVIKYDVPEASNVRISIYNLLGEEVATLVNGRVEAGRQSVEWNANNSNGKSLSTGTYIYRMHAVGLNSGNEYRRVSKMVLVK